MENLYAQATQNVALVDLSNRCWIEVKGGDSKKFLNGVLTNNIQSLQGASGCYASLLTPKGKMIADLYCYTCEDYFGIDCDVTLKPIILETLKKYIIFQKVALDDQSEKWGACAILGPKAKEFLQAILKNLPQKEFEYTFAEWNNFKLWILCKKRWGLDGFELWIHRNELPLLCKPCPELVEGEGLGGGSLLSGLPELDKATQEVLRIESATPLFGVDMDENTIPQEANLYNALSFNKGCYVGQETIARLEHRGHVGKKLVQLKLKGTTVPKKGEKILTTDGAEAGWVTSACFSLKHNAPLILGYIRYTFLNLNEFHIGDFNAVRLKHLDIYRF